MRQKTYLSPERQLERSIVLVQSAPRSLIPQTRLNHYMGLGQIVQNHRYFLRGDLVFVRFSNGMAVRHPVWAVSSKGFVVKDYYMQYARFRDLECFDAGPLRIFGLPAHLEDASLDDPAAQMQMLQLRLQPLRTGNAADG